MLAFRIGQCIVRLNFSFFALIAFCCIFTGAGGGLACFLAVCIHETAHIVTMGILGVWPAKVRLSALGCRVELHGQNILTDWQNIWISLAGPGANWLSMALTYMLGFGDCAFFGASFAMAFAHSLPIEPLDGGLALRYFLRSKYTNEKADRISRVISILFLIPLATLGFLILFNTSYNYSLLALSIYLTLYLVLKWDISQP